MKKENLRPKPVRSNIVPVRFHTSEFQILLEKAHVYSHGNISGFIRLACLNYKPIKKVKV